ncbi:MAG TPA: hypothetical protein VLZ06_09945 [Solirubrobacteraceae bacterium]|nr:hypothetical protein [Solirubrobacteraceae bacterium]
MSTHDTSVDDTAALEYEPETDEDWFEDEELPRRPRRRLLGPIPAVLLAIILLAGGFLAGVEVQKNEGGSSTSGSGLAGLAALRGAAGGKGSTGSGSSSGFPGFGGGGGLAGGGVTTGEVSYVDGNTLYVTSAEGNTVKVSVPRGTNVSKTVSTDVHSVHPGDTVLVRGSQSGNGKVTASSVSITASGSSSGSSSSSSSSSGSSATPQLFGGG